MTDSLTIKERLANAYRAYATKTPPRELFDEVAYADPFRLMPMSQFTQYNPDDLLSRQGLRIVDKMRLDDQIKACLLFKKLSVISTGWTIATPDPDLGDDWEPREFIEDVLRTMPGTLNTTIIQILTALDYGFSVSEKLFAPVESGPWKGKIGLAGIKTRRPHNLGFRQNEYGDVTSIVQYDSEDSAGSAGGRDLPVWKFIRYSYLEEFQNPYGQSDLRTAYRHWWNKDAALKWLMMLIQRYGIPPLIGLYDKNEISGKQLDDLKTIFSRLQAVTNMLIPGLNGAAEKSFEAVFPQVGDNVGRVFEPALKYFDTAIAKSLLMPNLLGISPEQVSGSLARSRTSFDLFLLLIEYLQKEIAETVINEQIIKQLIDLNYSDTGGIYPCFEFLPMTDDIRVDLLEQWGSLVNSGTVHPTREDEAHVRDLLGFPETIGEPDEPDESDDDPDDDPDDDDDENQGDDDPGSIRDNRLGDWGKVYSIEGKVNYKVIGKYMEGAENAALANLKTILDSTESSVIKYVVKNGVSPQTIAAIDRYSPEKRLKEELVRHLINLFNAGRNEIRNEVPRETGNAEDSGAGYIPHEAIAYLRAKGLEIASTTSQTVLSLVKKALAKSLELGETGRKAADRLRGIFAPFVGAVVDGQQMQPIRLENIVRTETTHAYNMGRIVEMRRPGIADRIQGVMYSAIMDNRTTPVCQSLDGKIFKLGDPALDTLKPPNHYMCRSLLVPVTVYDKVNEEDFITPRQIGSATELALKGFT